MNKNINLYMREYYKMNKEKNSLKMKEYYEKNKEYIIERQTKYNINNIPINEPYHTRLFMKRRNDRIGIDYKLIEIKQGKVIVTFR